jgi:hypothetical protein
MAAVAAGVLLAGCAARPLPPVTVTTDLLDAAPTTFCAAAQRVVGRTGKVGQVVVHQEFETFVKSKTSIEPLTLHAYAWAAPDDPARAVAISCKLKSADHLNTAFGAGTAGPEGLCQDMNRETLRQVRASLPGAARRDVVLDPDENIFDDAHPEMAGPNWLAPFQLTYLDGAGVLHIHAKGFRVDWADPRFATLDGRFRGVHYCHLIAPTYLRDLLAGSVAPGVTVGREVSRAPPPRQ